LRLLAFVRLVFQNALIHKHFAYRFCVKVLNVVYDKVVAPVELSQLDELVKRSFFLHGLLADDVLYVA